MLNINFINDLTLKTIHDLLMDCETEELTLREELDGSVNINYLFWFGVCYAIIGCW